MSSLYRANMVQDLIQSGDDASPAIGAPGRTTMTHRQLRALAAQTVKTLNGMGIGRNDRVAIVLPNGPEMASAFICIACGATTAPLNPAYRAEELIFYLSDLNAKALVTLEGMESPAREVAKSRNIPIVSLVPGETAGDFTLAAGAIDGRLGTGGFAQEDDIALVLHTSGTTSRPKIVPLSQKNVTASAYHIGNTLALRENDVCLNIMPLFHIHGLIAATLSSIAAGASVVCTPGFNALKFFSWFAEVRPTWYTAVPTMHQAILARADRNTDAIGANRLRFVRSSSSSLPPQVMEALEKTFNVPVVEAYGMTEASHQMASNPLPPRARFAGSVGIAAGPDVAIMDEAGKLLAAGDLGEVVIRGRNVTSGYEANPDANAKAFTNGWFRTGDQGVMDKDGYLRLTGRLKELINRGGEKISPLEVDTVIMDHPAIAQVVTFGVPHDMLGEDVAAAVVLRENAACDERELRAFVSGRLADFKVPRRIVFLTEIPKGATGKLQRIGLHEKLAAELGRAMKIAVFGAGAIGGYLAVKLKQSGADVSVVARGPHLAAIRERGLTLKSEGTTATVQLPCTDKAEELGPQDYVVVTLKANALPGASGEIAKLMGPDTALVTGVNGIPYWYFHGLEAPWRDRVVESVDPGGKLWRALPPRQAIGCIVYPAAAVVEPGVIEHTYGNRFTLGEPDGSKSPRVEALSQRLTKAGLKAPVRANIRDELWVKLWGNLAFNPLSALTASTLDRLAFRPELRAVAHTMMTEAQGVAEALGVKFAVSIDKRIDGAGEVGVHKTSMLQDLERGRPMEIDALLGAVVELAALTGKPVPLCEAVLALVRERARQAGCYSQT